MSEVARGRLPLMPFSQLDEYGVRHFLTERNAFFLTGLHCLDFFVQNVVKKQDDAPLFRRVDEQGNLNRHDMNTITSGVSDDVDTRIAATAEVLRTEREDLYDDTMRQVDEKDSTVRNDLLNGPIRNLEIRLIDLGNDLLNNRKFRLASHGERCLTVTHMSYRNRNVKSICENLPFLDPRRSF